MNTIILPLNIEPWPVIGEHSFFFGYLIAVGLSPAAPDFPDGPERFILHADFSFHGVCRRYRVPADAHLVTILNRQLQCNIAEQVAGDQVQRGNLMISRTPDGYAVDRINETTLPGFEELKRTGRAKVGGMELPWATFYPQAPEAA